MSGMERTNIPTKPYPFVGGLDTATPMFRMAPGRAIAALNYEPVQRGYARIDGVERLDGQPKPSSAAYWTLYFSTGTATIAEGATVTGATSGATGKALIAMVVSSGSFGGSDAVGYLVLTTVSGTFAIAENLQVGGVTKCVSIQNPQGIVGQAAVSGGAATDANDATWQQDAIETARTLIQKPSGSGAIRGVGFYNGNAYCVRDNAGATAGVLYKSTTAGWSAVALGRNIHFGTGTGEITSGQTVTGATSGATGVVTRVVLRTGLWGSNATGQLIFATTTGTFSSGENLQVGGVTKAVSTSISAAITLPAGGKYEFDYGNFFGASNLFRMYGCNGVGLAFEWDGTVFVPIETGMTVDTPKHLAIHKNQLFLAFPGGSLQNSSIGNPYGWSPLTGASEIGMGDDITGLIEDFNFVMVVGARNHVKVLYGNDPTDFDLQPHSSDSGMIEWTVQKIAQPLYFDDRGIRSLQSTQAFGDFVMGTLTNDIDPLIRLKQKNGVTPVASLRCRNKGQYRVFFSDGTGLSGYVGREAAGGSNAQAPTSSQAAIYSGVKAEWLPFNLGITVNVACSAKDTDGTEVMLIGTSAGWVMQLDKGTNLDGSELESFIRLSFNNVGSETMEKRFHKATVLCDVQPSITLGILTELSYGATESPPAIQQDFTVMGAGGYWNVDSWNQFFWSSPVAGMAECKINGKGTNVSVCCVHRSTYDPPEVLYGLVLHWSPRRLKR